MGSNYTRMAQPIATIVVVFCVVVVSCVDAASSSSLPWSSAMALMWLWVLLIPGLLCRCLVSACCLCASVGVFSVRFPFGIFATSRNINSRRYSILRSQIKLILNSTDSVYSAILRFGWKASLLVLVGSFAIGLSKAHPNHRSGIGIWGATSAICRIIPDDWRKCAP